VPALATQRRVVARAERQGQTTSAAALQGSTRVPQPMPVHVLPLRATAVGAATDPAEGSCGRPRSPQMRVASPRSSVTGQASKQSARVEQMSAVAQSLQAAAVALQRAAAASPPTEGITRRRVSGPGRDGTWPERAARDAAHEGERDATVARLVGAAQRVRADWVAPNESPSAGGGMLSQLSRENAALREALNDTTRKLNALAGEKLRLDGDNAMDTSAPNGAASSAPALTPAPVAAEAAARTHVASEAWTDAAAEARAALVEAVSSATAKVQAEVLRPSVDQGTPG